MVELVKQLKSNEIEKNYDNITKYLGLGIRFLKFDRSLQETAETLKQATLFIAKFNNYFSGSIKEPIKLSEMLKIMKEDKKWVLENIVRKIT